MAKTSSSGITRCRLSLGNSPPLACACILGFEGAGVFLLEYNPGMLPSREQAQELLFAHVTDPYQRHHALMVGTAVEGYGRTYGEDAELWFLTGYLHDIDFQEFPAEHPGRSLQWFKEWGYPTELIHAVEGSLPTTATTLGFL